MAAKVKNFKEFDGLSTDEITTIITFLVEFEDRVDMVREEFEAVFDRKISPKVIFAIRDKYKAVITEKRALISSHGRRGVPAMRRSVRMRLFQRLLKKAFKKELRYSVKVAPNDYVEVWDIDKKAALNTLIAMERCMNDAKRLELEEYRILSEIRGEGDEDEDLDDDVSFENSNSKAQEKA